MQKATVLSFPLQATAEAVFRAGPYLTPDDAPLPPGPLALNALTRLAREARNLARACRAEHGECDISLSLDDLAAMAQAALVDAERLRDGECDG